jgi:cell wall-associated NlpC family hydrolase
MKPKNLKLKKLVCTVAAATLAITFTGCAKKDKDEEEQITYPPYEESPLNPPDGNEGNDEIVDNIVDGDNIENDVADNTIADNDVAADKNDTEEKVEEIQTPTIKKITYIRVTADSVNIRTGSGTTYSSLGTAEKNTLYAMLGKENGWYKTKYRSKTAYISEKYCVEVDMTASSDSVEKVIYEGVTLLGTPYVYGATRIHDGKGNLLKGFSLSKFDCSSLTQFMFYKGTGKLLDVTTRTQILQGTTVKKSNLQRGDLMFFTNDSRKNNTGIERVGHVAVYLGDNLILHTASDYAKIEEISAKRWSYFIQAQRMI